MILDYLGLSVKVSQNNLVNSSENAFLSEPKLLRILNSI